MKKKLENHNLIVVNVQKKKNWKSIINITKKGNNR